MTPIAATTASLADRVAVTAAAVERGRGMSGNHEARHTGGGGGCTGVDGLIKIIRKIQPGVRGRAGKGGMLRGQGGAHTMYDTEMAGGDSTSSERVTAALIL